MGTGGPNPLQCRFDYFHEPGFVKSAVVPHRFYPDTFPGQGAGNKQGLTLQAGHAASIVAEIEDFHRLPCPPHRIYPFNGHFRPCKRRLGVTPGAASIAKAKILMRTTLFQPGSVTLVSLF